MSQNKIWNAEDYVVEPLSAVYMLRSKLLTIKVKQNQLCELFLECLSEATPDINLVGVIYEDIERKTNQEILNYSSSPFVERTTVSSFLTKMESVERSFDKQIMTLSQKD